MHATRYLWSHGQRFYEVSSVDINHAEGPNGKKRKIKKKNAEEEKYIES